MACPARDHPQNRPLASPHIRRSRINALDPSLLFPEGILPRFYRTGKCSSPGVAGSAQIDECLGEETFLHMSGAGPLRTRPSSDGASACSSYGATCFLPLGVVPVRLAQ